MELKTAASAVFFRGDEGGISYFHMDLEMAMKSTIYIHKQPQNCFKFSRPFTEWTLLGRDLVAEKLKQDYKSCLQNSLQRICQNNQLHQENSFDCGFSLMHYCNKSYCHHKCNTTLLSDSRAGQTRTLEKDFCEIQRSEFVTQSQQTRQKDNFIKICTAFFL